MAETRKTPIENATAQPQRHIYQLRGFWPCVIFALTFATHGFYIVEMVSHPFFNFPLVDSDTYHNQALDILQHGWVGNEVFWQAPLYPYFLALCYHFITVKFFDIRVIQAVLAAINAVLLYEIGRRRIGRGVAIGAAVATAFYGPLIFFDAEMLAPVLIVSLYLLMALALDYAIRDPKIAMWPVAGALNGLSALAHGLGLLIAPLVCAYGFFGRFMRSLPPKKRLTAVALFLAGTTAVIAPVTIRNRLVGGEWVLISYNGPVNLYIGNHPDYDRMVGLRPGLEWASLIRSLNELGITTVGELSRHYTQGMLINLRKHPFGVARVWFKKLYLFFHADELRRNYPIYPVRDYSNLMWALLWKWTGPAGLIGLGFPFGLVLPLAALGWWALRRQGIRLVAVELIMAGHFAANLMFFICSRYRVPLAPFFLLYAAAGVQWILGEQIWRAQSFRLHWRPLVVALAILLISNARLTPMDNAEDRAEYQFHLGFVRQKGAENAREAINRYQKMVREKPKLADARLVSDLVSQHTEKTQRALEHYLAALRDNPNHTETHFFLGILYQDHLREPAKALEQFDWVLERDPGNMPVMFDRALSLAGLGRTDEAREILETLVQNDPDNEEYRGFLDQLSGKTTAPQSESRTQGRSQEPSPTPGPRR